MNIYGGIVAIGAVLAAAVFPTLVQAQAPLRGTGSYSIDGPVRVIEGDTLEVRIEGRRVGVLVAGIIAPHANTPCGQQAAQALQALVERGVVLHEDLGLPTFDQRLLRIYRVFDPAGRLIAEELARAGVALPAQATEHAIDFPVVAAAAADAAANRRGCATRSSSR
jgi:endonuclease YncB( thermonuclease family)